jgi:hypothetical protein
MRPSAGIEVRDADVAELALVDELLERSSGIGERDVRVGPVHLIEVDVVNAERLQALVDSTAKPSGARVANEPMLGHPQAALGSDHDLVTAVVEIVTERSAEKPLRGAEAIALSGVEEVDPELACVADRRDAVVLVDPSPIRLRAARRRMRSGRPRDRSSRA